MRRTGTILALVAAACFGAQVPEDPVLKARAQRAQAAGIPESDLPPVPRSILEPPPLPPPELHPRDMKGSRSLRAAKRSSKKGKTVKGKPGKAPRPKRRR